MKVLIAGGGTAGWITALLLRRYQPDVDITLIESSKKGRVGVGEATTNAFMYFLSIIGLSASDVIRNASGTIKSTIKFTNWNGGGDKDMFFNPFGVDNNLSPTHAMHCYEIFGKSFGLIHSIANDELLFKNDFTGRLNNDFKIPLTDRLQDLGEYALHFDASMLADYFRGVAKQRGINVVDKEILEFCKDDSGNICAVKTVDDSQYDCDFIFDATGLSRLIINGEYDAEWQTASDQVINNSAIPFHRDIDWPNVEPCTTGRAMRNGWVWNIPLQDRYGCGYVFNDQYVTEEEVIDEIYDIYGQDVSIKKKISFEAGHTKTPWVNNCIAVGLSSGFIEPLESTSIWVTILYALEAVRNFDRIKNPDQAFIDDYNEKFCKSWADVIDYVALHYQGNRSDSQYWIDARNMKKSDRLEEFINRWSKTPPDDSDDIGSMFDVTSWTYIHAGVGGLSKDVCSSYLDANNYTDRIDMRVSDLQKRMFMLQGSCISHSGFIDKVMSSEIS